MTQVVEDQFGNSTSIQVPPLGTSVPESQATEEDSIPLPATTTFGSTDEDSDHDLLGPRQQHQSSSAAPPSAAPSMQRTSSNTGLSVEHRALALMEEYLTCNKCHNLVSHPVLDAAEGTLYCNVCFDVDTTPKPCPGILKKMLSEFKAIVQTSGLDVPATGAASAMSTPPVGQAPGSGVPVFSNGPSPGKHAPSGKKYVKVRTGKHHAPLQAAGNPVAGVGGESVVTNLNPNIELSASKRPRAPAEITKKFQQQQQQQQTTPSKSLASALEDEDELDSIPPPIVNAHSTPPATKITPRKSPASDPKKKSTSPPPQPPTMSREPQAADQQTALKPQSVVDHEADQARRREEQEISKKCEKLFEDLANGQSAARTGISTEEATSRIDLMKAVSEFKKKHFKTSKNWKVEGDSHYELSEYKQAIHCYSKAIDLNDGTSRGVVIRGNRSAAYFMVSAHKECVEDCKLVIADDPKNVKMYQRAIKSLVILGEIKEALELGREVVSREQTDLKASGVSGPGKAATSLQRDLERLNDASAILDKIASSAAVGADAATNIAGVNEVEDNYRMLMQMYPDTISFKEKFCDYMAKLGRWDAIQKTADLIPLSHRTVKIVCLHSRSFFMSGFEFFDKARDRIKEAPQAIQADILCQQLLAVIEKVDSGKNRGNQHFSAKEFAESIREYTKAIDADSTNKKILRILYCNRAAANKELNQFKEGVEDCTNAIKLDPNFSKAYARRARCHLNLQDFVRAINDFKEAMRLEPHDKELARELQHAEQAKEKEAQQLAKKDYYFTLGLQRNATDRDIKLKFREMSLKWHPDKWASNSEEEKAYAENKFKAINEAYETLKTADKRREYDLKLDRERFASARTTSAHAGAGSYGSSYFDPRGTAGPAGGSADADFRSQGHRGRAHYGGTYGSSHNMPRSGTYSSSGGQRKTDFW